MEKEKKDHTKLTIEKKVVPNSDCRVFVRESC